MKNLKYLFIFIFLFTKIFAHDVNVFIYDPSNYNSEKTCDLYLKLLDGYHKEKSESIIELPFASSQDIKIFIDEKDILIEIYKKNEIELYDKYVLNKEQFLNDLYKFIEEKYLENNLIYEKQNGGPFKVNIVAVGSAIDIANDLVKMFNNEEKDYIRSIISVNFVKKYKKTRIYADLTMGRALSCDVYSLCGMQKLKNDILKLYVIKMLKKEDDEKMLNLEDLVKNKTVEKQDESEIEEDVKGKDSNIVNGVKDKANPPVIVLSYEDFQKIVASQQNKNDDIDDACCFGKCTDRRVDRILRITELTLKVLLKVAV